MLMILMILMSGFARLDPDYFSCKTRAESDQKNDVSDDLSLWQPRSVTVSERKIRAWYDPSK